ncbi:ParA family protein [Clostridium sp.]|uniref:ParA family protein n=1 Tax=Clostridium sp. TaxID=1506 RepID=UPI0025B7EAB3|nr:ParA family protein [Clostridium sp.]
MHKIISFINQKGGTGKTTLSLNISAILADKGYKVLLIDTDTQGNLTNTFFKILKKRYTTLW